MQYQRTYTPADESTDGLVDGATGADSPLDQEATSAGDGLAHRITITSAADISGITFTVTGTDEFGRPQTEDVVGPAATTVEGTKYFLTVTSIEISGTLGSDTADIGWADEWVAPPVGFSPDEITSLTVQVSGTINWTQQNTTTNFNRPSWNGSAEETVVWADSENAGMVAETGNGSDTLEGAFYGGRIKANSYSSGATLTFSVASTRRR